MPDYDRNCFRLACLLQQGLQRPQTQDLTISLPWWEFQHCQDLHRKLERARSRKFTLAAATLATDLETVLIRLCEQLSALLAEQGRASSIFRVPSLRDLYDEVRGLSDEFDTVEYDLRKRLIIVTTAPIELEDVYLGKFDIRLDLNDLGKTHPYLVIAKDPHTAAGNESVTHPHVQGKHLCEGDGKIPIQRALASGRLSDFFHIVTQILNTYNPGSAHAQLDEWSEGHCTDCGDTFPADEIRCCDRCDSSVCDDCISCCAACSNRICASCGQSCARCGCCFCSACLTPCKECKGEFCQSCLSDGKCKTCHDRNSTENESGTSDDLTVAAIPPATGEADLALQPAGLEQAPLPA